MSDLAREMASMLREAIDKGLIYWEPRTQRGAVAKAAMIARMEAAISKAVTPKYATEGQAIEDWMTIAPEYRTRERLEEMKLQVCGAASPLSSQHSNCAPTQGE